MKLYFIILLIAIPTGGVSINKNNTLQAIYPLNCKQIVRDVSKANGFFPSKRIIRAIVNASKKYGIDCAEMAAIAIVESGIGKYLKSKTNKNGSDDIGLFQINTVNYEFCIEYNLSSFEGSAFCAGKILLSLKSSRSDYLGAYHSKTPSKKAIYLRKVNKVFSKYKEYNNTMIANDIVPVY